MSENRGPNQIKARMKVVEIFINVCVLLTTIGLLGGYFAYAFKRPSIGDTLYVSILVAAVAIMLIAFIVRAIRTYFELAEELDELVE